MSCKTSPLIYREIDRQRDGGASDSPEWLMSRAPGPLTLHDYLIPGDGAQCFRPVLVRRRRGLGGDAALSTCVRMRKKHAARRATDCLFHRTPRNRGIYHPDMNGWTRVLDPCTFGPFRMGPCVQLPWVIVSILQVFPWMFQNYHTFLPVRFGTFKSCKLILRLILQSFYIYCK
jgi:hypothetical protein